MKSKGTAYLLWFFSIFGWLGFHHYYLGKVGKGLIWMFTLGLFGIGSLVDLFTLGSAVETYNLNQELKTIRTVSMAAVATASSAASTAATASSTILAKEMMNSNSSNNKE
jgi:TM2 domain-containing membrane protein YozV